MFEGILFLQIPFKYVVLKEDILPVLWGETLAVPTDFSYNILRMKCARFCLKAVFPADLDGETEFSFRCSAPVDPQCRCRLAMEKEA